MEIQFKTRNLKQLEAVEAWIDPITEEILYGGAKAGGKSFLGASLIFGDALIYPGTQYYIARKELNDLRKYTIPTIYEVFEKWGLKFDDYCTFNGQDNFFLLKNGSKVFLIACKEEPSDPLFERFGSMQMTRGWIEEAGEVAEAAKANLWLATGRWKNQEYDLKKKQLLTANPKKGWLKRDFVDPFKAKVLPITRKFIQAYPTDNPYLTTDYLNTLSGEKDKVRRQRLWEGNWDYEEDMDSLVSIDALGDMFSNTITKDNQKYLVVDVARMGKDSTVFSFWDGLELYRVDKYQKQDTANTAQKIRDAAATERIPYSNIMVDEDGIGGGVVDNLFGVRGFVANSTALPTRTEIRTRLSKITSEFTPKVNFANLKSQCAFKLAELVNEHLIAAKVPEYRESIIEDLAALLKHKNADSDGKLQIKPKADVKIDLNRSPDIGDTLIMRMWFELKSTASLTNPDREHVVTMQNNRLGTNENRFRNGAGSNK